MKIIIIALLLMLSAHSNAQPETEKEMEQEKINLIFSPQSLHGVYGINYYFQPEGGNPQRVQFEVSVVYCGQYMEDYSIYHIDKSKFVINRNGSSEYLYDIAKRCAPAIYPVTVLTDNKGTPVYIRINDIKKRWLAARPEIDQYYEGEAVEQYLNNVENFVNNKAEWEHIITDDLFLSHLFSIFNQKENNSSFNKKIALIPFQSPLVFDCSQNINKENINPEYEVIRIVREGITNVPYKSDLLSPRAKVPMEKRAGQLKSKFKLQYTLDKSNLYADAIEGDFEIWVNDKIVSTTRLTGFRLDEKPLPYGEDPYFVKKVKKQRRMDHPSSNESKNLLPTKDMSEKYLQELNKVSLNIMAAILPVNPRPEEMILISEED